MANALDSLTEHSMQNLKTLLDANTVIGQPITPVPGITILPVSKVSVGFASGGTDIPASKELFGGGSGGGISVTPVAFLIIQNGEIKVQQIQTHYNTVDHVVEMVPDMVNQVSGMVSGKKSKKAKAAGDEDEVEE